jgi:tetratricopeptide (TPR) repeat protein
LIEGVELLTQHCLQHLPNWRLEDEHRYWLVDIVRRLDGIPLALDLAGSRLREMSLRDLHAHLVDRFAVLDGRIEEGQPTLYRAMQWSIEELSEEHQYLLFDLSIFPQAFTVDMVHGIVNNGWSHIACLEMLEVLAQQQLVLRTLVGREVQYSLLTSVREFAEQQILDERRSDLLQRHANYFASQILMRPIVQMWESEDWDWLAEHTEHCVMAARYGDSIAAKTCSVPILNSLLQRGPWQRAIELITQLTSRSTVDTSVVDYWQIQRLKMLDLLQETEAFESLVQTLQERFDGWSLVDGSVHQQTMLVYFYRVHAFALMRVGRFQEAEEILNDIKHWRGDWTYTREVLEAEPQLGEMLLESGMIWANLLFQTGHTTNAIAVLDPIVHLYHRQGWQRNTAIAASALGEYYHKNNQSDKGLMYMDMALKLFQQLGNVSAMNTMEKIGMCYQRQGAYDQALSWFERALEAGRHHRCYEGSLFCNMGSISVVLGDYATAVEQYHEGMRIFKRKQMRRLEAIFLCNLAIVHHMLGNFEESERLFLEDIEISTEMGLNGHLALIYGNLGDLYLDMDRVPKAIGFLLKCMQQAEAYYPLVKTVFMASLALAYAMDHQPVLALKTIREQPIQEIENYKEEYIKALCKHVVIQTIAGNHDEAQQLRQKISSMDVQEFASDSLVMRWIRRIMR